MTLLEKRDVILDSLRTQFRSKIHKIIRKRRGLCPTCGVMGCSGQWLPCAMHDADIDKLILDIANNAAQALVDEDDDPAKCPTCGNDRATHHAIRCTGMF